MRNLVFVFAVLIVVGCGSPSKPVETSVTTADPPNPGWLSPVMHAEPIVGYLTKKGFQSKEPNLAFGTRHWQLTEETKGITFVVNIDEKESGGFDKVEMLVSGPNYAVESDVPNEFFKSMSKIFLNEETQEKLVKLLDEKPTGILTEQFGGLKIVRIGSGDAGGLGLSISVQP